MSSRLTLRLVLGFLCAYAPLFFLLSHPTYFQLLSKLFTVEARWIEPRLRELSFEYADKGADKYQLRYRIAVEREASTPEASTPEGPVVGLRVAQGAIRGVIMFLNPTCAFALILAWPGATWRRKIAGLAVGAVLLLVAFSVYVQMYILSETFVDGSAQKNACSSALAFLEAGGATALLLLADAAAFFAGVGLRPLRPGPRKAPSQD